MKRILRMLLVSVVLLMAFGVASAEDIVVSGKDGVFELDGTALDAVKGDAVSIKVVYTDTNDGWGDIGFGASEGSDWKSWTYNNPAGENVEYTIPVKELLESMKVGDVAALTFFKIEAYNGATISSVTIVMPKDEPEVIELTGKDGVFELDADALAAVVNGKVDSFKVVYTDTNDGWGDIGFGASEGSDWKSWTYNNPAGENVEYTISAEELISNMKVGTLSALSYFKVESYNGATISSVTLVLKGDSGSSTEPTDTPTTTPTDAPTTAPTDAPATAPDADANAGNDQPQTGDNGIAVLAVVAMISLAGAVVVKKHNA